MKKTTLIMNVESTTQKNNSFKTNSLGQRISSRLSQAPIESYFDPKNQKTIEINKEALNLKTRSKKDRNISSSKKDQI